jgi:DNA-binding FadR family transcriptional regulator
VIDATRAVLSNEGNIAAQDTAFHMALARCAHNEVLARLLNSFYRISYSRRFALFADTRRGMASANQHERVYDALKKRDVKMLSM